MNDLFTEFGCGWTELYTPSSLLHSPADLCIAGYDNLPQYSIISCQCVHLCLNLCDFVVSLLLFTFDLLQEYTFAC